MVRGRPLLSMAHQYHMWSISNPDCFKGMTLFDIECLKDGTG